MPRPGQEEKLLFSSSRGKCICFRSTLKWWLLWTLIIRFRLRLWNMRLRMRKVCQTDDDEHQCQLGSKWFQSMTDFKSFSTSIGSLYYIRNMYQHYRRIYWFSLLSLNYSFVSGISLLGTSTEIYVYGTQYAFILITLAISGLISWYIFLPVFCNLQLTSTYEVSYTLSELAL